MMCGSELSDWMREKYHLELEMSGADYVVAITSFMDTAEGMERLKNAFLEIDGQLCEINLCEMNVCEVNLCDMNLCETGLHGEVDPHAAMTLSRAVNAPYDTVEIEESVGRTASEFVYIYPPGIPILAPGEVITEQAVNKILHYKAIHLPVQGMADRLAEKIRVVRKLR